MTLLRDLWAFLRDVPNLIARWCDQQVADAHRPEPMATDDLGAWPGGVMPVCLRCNVVWPCEAFVTASNRMDVRSS